jgi:hypothetical protein
MNSLLFVLLHFASLRSVDTLSSQSLEGGLKTPKTQKPIMNTQLYNCCSLAPLLKQNCIICIIIIIIIIIYSTKIFFYFGQGENLCLYATWKAKSRDKAKNRSALFKACKIEITEYNFYRNQSIRESSFSKPQRLLKLKGKTVVTTACGAEYEFDYPILREKKHQFVEFLSSYSGALPLSLNEFNINLLKPFLLRWDNTACFFVPYINDFFFESFGEFITVSIVSPLFEETIKHYTGLLLPLCEFYFAPSVSRLIPFFLHCFTLLFPEYYIRVIIHSFYNILCYFYHKNLVACITCQKTLGFPCEPLYCSGECEYCDESVKSRALSKSRERAARKGGLDFLLHKELSAEEAHSKFKVREDGTIPSETLSDKNEIKYISSGDDTIFSEGYNSIMSSLPTIPYDKAKDTFSLIGESVSDNIVDFVESDNVVFVTRLVLSGRLLLKGMLPEFIGSLIANKWLIPIYDFVKCSFDSEDPVGVIKELFQNDFSGDCELHIVAGEINKSRLIFKLINRLMPKSIALSPTLQSVYAFFSLTIGSYFFDSYEAMISMSHLFKIDPLSSTEDTLVDCVLHIFKGIKAVYKSGDLYQFFTQPKVFGLRMRCQEFCDDRFMTFEVMEAKLKGVKELQEEVAFSNDPALAPFRSKIALFAKNLQQRLDRVKTRDMPLVVWLWGSPGSGKTTALQDIQIAYERAVGHTVDPSKVARVDYCKSFSTEGTSPDSEIFILNDVKAEWKGDNKTKDTPFEVTLQALMDVEPYQPSKAVAEEKGMVYSNLRLIIVTSNPKNFSFDSDVLKLERRFEECCAIFNQELMVNQKVVQYKDFAKDTNFKSSMNEKIFYQKSNMVPDNTRFSFQPANRQWMSHRNWIMYLEDFFKTRILLSSRNRQIVKRYCPCKRSIVSHMVDGKFVPFPRGQCVEPASLPHVDESVCVVCGNLSALHDEDTIYCKGNSMQADSKYSRQGIRQKPLFSCDRCRETFEDYLKCDCQTKVCIGNGCFAAGKCSCLFTDNECGICGENAGVCDCKLLRSSLDVYEFSFYATLFFVLSYFMRGVWNKFDLLISSLIKVGSEINKANEISRVVKSDVDRLTRKCFTGFNKFQEGMKTFSIIISVACGTYLGWKTLKYFISSTLEESAKVITRDNVDHESLLMDTFKVECSYPDEIRKAWAQPNKKNFVNAVISKQNVSQVQLKTLATKNLFRFSCRYNSDGNSRVGYMLVLTPQYVLMNKHYFDNDNEKHWVVTIIKDGIEQVECLDKSRIRLVRHEGIICDLVVVKLSIPTLKSNLLDFWIKDISSVDQVPGCLPFPSPDIEINGNIVVLKPATWDVQGRGKTNFGPLLKIKNQYCKEGDCGVPYLAQFHGTNCILGTVAFSAPKDGYTLGCYVSQTDLIESINSFGEPYISELVLNCRTTSINPLSKLSQYREIDSYFLSPIGTISKPATFKSTIEETYCYKIVRDRNLLHDEYSPPTKSSVVVDGIYKSPLIHTFSHVSVENMYVPSLLSNSARVYYDYITKNIPKLKLSPLSLEEVFLGCPDQMIDRCNFNSSLGSYSLDSSRNRNDLFELCEQSQDNHNLSPMYRFKDIWKDEVMRVRSEMLKGNLECLHIGANIKDEVRLKSKTDIAKLRLFFTVDPIINILMKMYIAPLRSYLLKFPNISKIFAQINSSSNQWHELAKYLKFLGIDWDLVDLDFTSYDASHFCAMMDVVAYLVYKLALFFYENEEAASLCYYLVVLMKAKVMKHMGDIALILKLMPSGCDMTLMFNCFVNIILMIYGFQCLFPSKNASQFFELVRPATLGDDNLSAVHNSIPQFNAISLKEIYSEVGYRITNATKGPQVLANVSREDAQFLKRKFRFDPDIGEYMAPLDSESIWKMLSFWDKDKQLNVSFSVRMSQAFDVAQREFFLYGKEYLSEIMPVLRELADIQDISVPWKTYEDMKSTYISGSFEMNWI